MSDNSENLPPDFDPLLAQIDRSLADVDDALATLAQRRRENQESGNQKWGEVSKAVADLGKAAVAASEVGIAASKAAVTVSELVIAATKTAVTASKAVIAANKSTAGSVATLNNAVKALRDARADNANNSLETSESIARHHESLKKLREITAMLIAWRANGYKTEGMYDTGPESDGEAASEDEGSDEAESEDDGGPGESEA